MLWTRELSRELGRQRRRYYRAQGQLWQRGEDLRLDDPAAHAALLAEAATAHGLFEALELLMDHAVAVDLAGERFRSRTKLDQLARWGGVPPWPAGPPLTQAQGEMLEWYRAVEVLAGRRACASQYAPRYPYRNGPSADYALAARGYLREIDDAGKHGRARGFLPTQLALDLVTPGRVVVVLPAVHQRAWVRGVPGVSKPEDDAERRAREALERYLATDDVPL